MNRLSQRDSVATGARPLLADFILAVAHNGLLVQVGLDVAPGENDRSAPALGERVLPGNGACALLDRVPLSTPSRALVRSRRSLIGCRVTYFDFDFDLRRAVAMPIEET